jgi:LuxR family transcriptional regulator, maltose regulon positive regulatory protein
MPRRSSVHGRADAWRAGSATPELCLPAPVHALVPAPLPFEVLEAKIRVPPVRPGTVSRTALVNRLRANTSLPVLTLTAPVGYGKTTLLAQWAARDARPLAWVAVDERDEDPVVLLRHVAAALHSLAPLHESVLESLTTPGESVWTTLLPRLGSALADLDAVVLVLDDAHLLRSPDSLDAIAALIDHLPDGAVLALAGRAEPRLPIAALRVEGRLLELGVDELALTPRETQQLVHAAGASVTLEDVHALVQHSEGWPAALYLAALALRERKAAGDDERIDLAGIDRTLTDYLRSEYLLRLGPKALRFLRRTAVLDEMCGALCDAVLATTGSARDLDSIDRANLFVVPLDRQRIWYRYHRLFRELLLRELEEHEPDLIGVLHRRAADWYEARGEAESALEHARAAGDLGRVARIVTAIAPSVYHNGRVSTVERWLSDFDEAALARYPAVALHGAWIHALRGRPDDAGRCLRVAEAAAKGSRNGSRSLRPAVAALRAALGRDGVERMASDAEFAVSALPRDSRILPSAYSSLAAAHLMLGEDEQADAVFATAAAEAERLGTADTRVLAMGQRSLIAATRDDTTATESLARDATKLVEQGSLEASATSAAAFAAAARSSLRSGRWDEAREAIVKLEQLTPLLEHDAFPWFSLQTRIQLARAHLALRDTTAARGQLTAIHDLVRAHPHVGVLAEQAMALEDEIDAMPEPGEASSTGLTAAELRLLPHLATHLSFREIGELLYVSRNTIKTQAISLYRKLGVSSRSDAIERATHLGLIEPHLPPAA